jgi:hypothetical protein
MVLGERRVAPDGTARERCANVGSMLSYLDPGTGSMIAAALAGGAAGFVVLMKLYWHRVLGVFSKKHRAEADAAKAQLVGDQNADADVNA